ncbi:hypothetical protein NC652_014014 [Populus alba x Populus x berolinensis]|nr:hypothetical protein NC652_014014 [Populus alba x Populus x berolinensis]
MEGKGDSTKVNQQEPQNEYHPNIVLTPPKDSRPTKPIPDPRNINFIADANSSRESVNKPKIGHKDPM